MLVLVQLSCSLARLVTLRTSRMGRGGWMKVVSGGALALSQLSHCRAAEVEADKVEDQATTSSPVDAAQLPEQDIMISRPGFTGFLEGQLEQFRGNQIATGGLALMVAGVSAAAGRSLLRAVWEYSKRRLLVRAEVDSRDDAYRWLMHWLCQQPHMKHSPVVSITTSLTSFGTAAFPGDQSGGGTHKVWYLPAPGDHLLQYKHHWLWISRQRNSGNPQLAANARLLLETLHITTWGPSSRKVIEELVEEAAREYQDSLKQRTTVYSVGPDDYWMQVGSRPMRPLKTVVLPEGQAEMLLADCRDFLQSEAWYAHHGIPYRRGYLLYGNPGTGKTSLVMALAGELQLDIYVLTLSSPSMTDDSLRHLMNQAAPHSILLLEDVDAAFVGREGATASGLSFSGLLNAIDGVAAQEGRLLFMTTNHIDRLSSALIRPGRVDVRCQFNLASRQQMRKLFISFYQDMAPASACVGVGLDTSWELPAEGPRDVKGGALQSPAAGSSHPENQEEWGPLAQASQSDGSSSAERSGSKPSGTSGVQLPDDFQDVAALADQFVALVQPHSMSMAQLQGYLMTHKMDPRAALANAHVLSTSVGHAKELGS